MVSVELIKEKIFVSKNKFVGASHSSGWVCMDSDTGVVFHVLCEKFKLFKIYTKGPIMYNSKVLNKFGTQ